MSELSLITALEEIEELKAEIERLRDEITWLKGDVAQLQTALQVQAEIAQEREKARRRVDDE